MVKVLATDDREEVLKAFEKYDRLALPVTDAEGHMLGSELVSVQGTCVACAVPRSAPAVGRWPSVGRTILR